MVEKDFVDVADPDGPGNLPDEPSKLTPDKLAPTGSPESKVKEEGEPEPSKGEDGKGKEKTVYTPEELEGLLQTGADVDTSRLSPEGRLLMKSFQRGYDGKFKELSDLRKKLESAEQQNQDPRERLFRRYIQSPAQVISEINAEVEKLEEVDPATEEYRKARQTIARLQGLKDEFAFKRQEIVESSRNRDVVFAKAQTEILEAIPDFEEKAPKLTNFAMDMGLTREEVMALTDPTIFGPLAVKLTKAMSKLYDKVNAGKSADKKEDKTAPKPLARPGAGGGEGEDLTPADDIKKIERMTPSEYRRYREGKK